MCPIFLYHLLIETRRTLTIENPKMKVAKFSFLEYEKGTIGGSVAPLKTMIKALKIKLGF